MIKRISDFYVRNTFEKYCAFLIPKRGTKVLNHVKKVQMRKKYIGMAVNCNKNAQMLR